MRFRQHRGLLEDSMKTQVMIKNWDELIGYIKGLLWEWPSAPPVTDETLHVKLYLDRGDARIGWAQTYIVTLEGYGVLGFTDGPCRPVHAETVPQAEEEK